MSNERRLSPLFTWRSAVASDRGPKHAVTRHVLLTLGLHMNEKGGSCFPSIDTLVQETALSRPTVIKHLQMAHADGWIEKTTVGLRGKRWRRSEYVALIPESYYEKDDESEGHEGGKGGKGGLPPEREGGKPRDEGGKGGLPEDVIEGDNYKKHTLPRARAREADEGEIQIDPSAAAYEIYRSLPGSTPNLIWMDLIETAVGNDAEDRRLWAEVCLIWATSEKAEGGRYNVANVRAMIDHFKRERDDKAIAKPDRGVQVGRPNSRERAGLLTATDVKRTSDEAREILRRIRSGAAGG